MVPSDTHPHAAIIASVVDMRHAYACMILGAYHASNYYRSREKDSTRCPQIVTHLPESNGAAASDVIIGCGVRQIADEHEIRNRLEMRTAIAIEVACSDSHMIFETRQEPRSSKK